MKKPRDLCINLAEKCWKAPKNYWLQITKRLKSRRSNQLLDRGHLCPEVKNKHCSWSVSKSFGAKKITWNWWWSYLYILLVSVNKGVCFLQWLSIENVFFHTNSVKLTFLSLIDFTQYFSSEGDFFAFSIQLKTVNSIKIPAL